MLLLSHTVYLVDFQTSLVACKTLRQASITHLTADQIPVARLTLVTLQARHVILALTLARHLVTHGGAISLSHSAIGITVAGLAVTLGQCQSITKETYRRMEKQVYKFMPQITPQVLMVSFTIDGCRSFVQPSLEPRKPLNAPIQLSGSMEDKTQHLRIRIQTSLLT